MLDDRPQRKWDGLSPSSFALYMGCQRKYYHKKVAKTEIDSDASEDMEAFQVGKAFHKLLEDTKHTLSGLTVGQIRLTTASFGLDDNTHAPLLFAMLRRYKECHEKAGLKAIAFEVPVETPDFFGIVDVILRDAQGGWWIGDMKTSASFSPMLVPTLPRHPQLNLYAAHDYLIAQNLEIKIENYKGCRYRLTTKSKLIRKKEETFKDYSDRIYKAVKSFDFLIPKDLMKPGVIEAAHWSARYEIDKVGDEIKRYTPNYGNCTMYHRPCEFWSQCHGSRYSDMQNLEVVTSG
jgi:hypothetical protein